jgi:ABC-type uncharacterized transport system permease subunit
MINFFPIQPLLGKDDFSDVRFMDCLSRPVFAAVFFTLAALFFNFSAKHYKSTGRKKGE